MPVHAFQLCSLRSPHGGGGDGRYGFPPRIDHTHTLSHCSEMPSLSCLIAWVGGWGLGIGEADIWTCPADVFASMANYLNRHGWQKEQRALAQVNLTKNPKAQGLDTVLAVEEWVQQYGVMAPDLPSNLKTSLVSDWWL